MSAPPMPASGELDPLRSAALRARFPNLAVALDGDAMAERLGGVLCAGDGLAVEACAKPKADLAGGVCRLQYPLRLRGPSGPSHELLVLATMFADSGDAIAFERAALAPQAARWRPRDALAVRPTGVVESLALAVSVFPVNGALPTLVDVTEPQRIPGVFHSIRERAGDVAVDGLAHVRFGRAPRCVLRYRVGPSPHAVVYGKVGSTVAVDAVRRALDALGRRAAARPDAGQPLVFPRLLGHSPELDLVLYSRVPGARADLATEAGVAATIDAAGRAAATMHACPIGIGPLRSLEAELGRARDAVARIREEAPGLAAWLHAIVERAGAAAKQTPRRSPAFAHGDFTPSQLLLEGSRIGILDFDDVCRAEPALDLGRFLAYLRVGLAKADRPPDDALTSRLLDAYHRTGGAATAEVRVDLHGVASLVLMAVHAWWRLKPARVHAVCAVLGAELARRGLPVRTPA